MPGHRTWDCCWVPAIRKWKKRGRGPPSNAWVHRPNRTNTAMTRFGSMLQAASILALIQRFFFAVRFTILEQEKCGIMWPEVSGSFPGREYALPPHLQ